MANIIGFEEPVKQCRVTCDTDTEDCFCCHTQTGTVEFGRTEEGLCSMSLPEGCEDEVQHHDKEHDAKSEHGHQKGHSNANANAVAENRGDHSTTEF